MRQIYNPLLKNGLDTIDGLTVGALDARYDARYLKLDASNDPITAGLKIDGSADEVQLTIEGNATQTANLEVWQTSAGTYLAGMSPLGHIGLGGTATDANSVVAVNKTFTDTTGTTRGGLFLVNETLTANNSNVLAGVQFSATIDQAGFNKTSGTAIRGMTNTVSVTGASGTVGGLLGASVTVTNSGGGTVTTAYGANVTIQNTGAGTIGTAYGHRIVSMANSGGGTITTAVGIQVEDLTVAGTNIALRTNAGLVVFNEGGDANADVRMEGDTNANTFFLDSSADAIAIGYATPYSRFDVAHTTGAILTLTRNDAAVAADDLIGMIQAHAIDNQTTTNPIAASIEFYATNTIGTDINPGRILLKTTGTAVAGALTERVRIDQSGNVGINTLANADAVLHIKGLTGVNNEILIIQAGDTQTSQQLTEWWDNSGGTLMSVTFDGKLTQTVTKSDPTATNNLISQSIILAAGASAFSANQIGFLSDISITGSAGGNATISGVAAFVSNDQTAGTLTNIWGNNADVENSNAGVTTNLTAYKAKQTVSGTGNVTTGRGFHLSVPTQSSSGVFVTNVGVDVDNQGLSGMTASYGVRINSQSGATNSYGIAVEAGSSGFGTLTPASLVDLESTTGAILTIGRNDASVTSGDSVGIIQFRANDTSTTTNFIVANIEAQAVNTITTDINPGRLIFRTTSTTVAATPTERMRIDHAGNVGIGVTPTFLFHVSETLTSASGQTLAAQVVRTTTDVTSNYNGTNLVLKAAHTSGAFTGQQMGMVGEAWINSTNTQSWTAAGTVNQKGLVGIEARIEVRSGASGTISHLMGLASTADFNTNSTATVSNYTGFKIFQPGNAGSLVAFTNQYGLYIDDMTSAVNDYAIVTNAGLVVINEGGDANSDVRIEGDTDPNLITTDSSTDSASVGVATGSHVGKFHIDQFSTTAAKPVLTVDQADVSEEFIRFIGSSSNGVLTQSIVEAADVGTATIAGYLKVFIQDDGNQLTDQAYFVPVYTLA